MTAPSDLSRAQRHVLALRQHALAGSLGVMVYCQLLITMYPAELAYVMRELGLKLKDSDDEQSIVDRIVRAITPQQENSTMKASQAEPAQASTNGGKKKKQRAADDEEQTNGSSKKAKRAAKAAAEDDGEGESAPRGGVAVGTSLVKLLEKGSDGRKLANRLAEGEELSAKQLGTLQEAINEAAGAAREAEDGKSASQLSAANRVVRRMRRSAEA